MYLTEVFCLMAVILLGHDHFRYYMPLCQIWWEMGKDIMLLLLMFDCFI